MPARSFSALITICLLLAIGSLARAQEGVGPAVLPPQPATAPALLPILAGLPVLPPQTTATSTTALVTVTPPAKPTTASSSIAPAEKFLNDPQLLLATAPVSETSVSIAQAPSWYHLAYWFGPTPWDLGFELGINGTEGINQALSFRTGGHIKRETDHWKFDNTMVYNKNSANGVETQNNALLDVRIDRKLGESPWSLYFLNQELYDEFQAFDLRVSANTGVGYQFIDTEQIDVVGRLGTGASREFGGPDDNTAYEALFGLEYDHELTKTQRLSAKLDYFPEWEDFNRYRVVTDLGWEIDLDKPGNLSLKFSIIDRYDSTPNGADPNELNYAVLLIWGI